MFQLVSLISYARACIIKVPVLHDILCGSDTSLCQTSNKHDCIWSMLLAGPCETRWANVPGPNSFVQRTNASPLQLRGRCINSQDLPCRGANCGLAPPHLQADERSRTQCLSLHSAFCHSVTKSNHQHPAAMKLHSCLFPSHVLPGMFLFHGHDQAFPYTSQLPTSSQALLPAVLGWMLWAHLVRR